MSHISKTPELPSVAPRQAAARGSGDRRDALPPEDAARTASAACASSTRRSAAIDDLGEWTREDARTWWTGARASVTMRVRGVVA